MSNILEPVLDELHSAIVKFPEWPKDPLHAVAIVQEEMGELTQAILQSIYEPDKSSPADVRAEAIQAAAMALRFAMNLAVYDYKPSRQVTAPAAHALDR